MKEKAGHKCAVRQMAKDVLVPQCEAAERQLRQDDVKHLWGEVLEVLHTNPPRIHLRDTLSSDQRIWVTLPNDASLPREGAMVCVEGSLRPHRDEGLFSIVWRFEGRSIVKSRRHSERIRKRREAVDAIASRYPTRPRASGPIRKIALVSSEASRGRRDFEHIFWRRVGKVEEWERPKCLFFPVKLQKSDSIASGICEAGKSDADLVVVVRGGGPKWELDLFNEPIVVEAMAALKQPVLIGIGHAGDKVEASRFAAHRAKTPSDAASLAAYLFKMGRAYALGLPRLTSMAQRAPRAESLPVTAPIANPPPVQIAPRTAQVGANPVPTVSAVVATAPVARYRALTRGALRVMVGASVLVGFFMAGWQGAPIWDRLTLQNLANLDAIAAQKSQKADLAQPTPQPPVGPGGQRASKQKSLAPKPPRKPVQPMAPTSSDSIASASPVPSPQPALASPAPPSPSPSPEAK